MTLKYAVEKDELITVGMLKDFLRFVPDGYILEYPAKGGGNYFAKNLSIDTNNENHTVSIGIGE